MEKSEISDEISTALPSPFLLNLSRGRKRVAKHSRERVDFQVNKKEQNKKLIVDTSSSSMRGIFLVSERI
jgi:hypothetical protein